LIVFEPITITKEIKMNTPLTIVNQNVRTPTTRKENEDHPSGKKARLNLTQTDGRSSVGTPVLTPRSQSASSAVKNGYTGQNETAFWRSKFHALRTQRETEAEKQLLKERSIASERESALKAMIRHLESRLGEATASSAVSEARSERDDARRREAEAKRDALEAKVEALRAENLNSQEENRNLRQVREMYQMLTCTKIVPASTTVHSNDDDCSNKKPSFDCTVHNEPEKLAAKYRLTVLTYAPKIGKEDSMKRKRGAESSRGNSTVSENDGKGVSDSGEYDNGTMEDLRFEPLVNDSLLPDFLRDTIDFDVTQGPALTQNILMSLFKT